MGCRTSCVPVSSPQAPTTGSPRLPLSWLHGERASSMVSTFHLTRSTELHLTHPKARKTRILLDHALDFRLGVVSEIDEQAKAQSGRLEAEGIGAASRTSVRRAPG